MVGWESSEGFNLIAPPRRVGALLPFVFEELPDVTFEAVPDLRMPVEDFFGTVDLTATLWVVEELMDAMVKRILSTAMR